MMSMLQSVSSLRGGQCIDLYNQAVHDDTFVSITTRVSDSNHYWVIVEE